jgi:hypothetical protein
MTINIIDATGATQTVQTLPAVGQKTSSGSLPVTIASDQSSVPVAVSGVVATSADKFAVSIISTTLTRQANATAYSVGQLIGSSATTGLGTSGSIINGFQFASFSRTAGGVIQLNRARLYKSQNTLLGKFELWVFRGIPTVTIGDTGVVASGVPIGSAGNANRLVGRFSFDMTTGAQGSDGAELGATPISGGSVLTTLPSGSSDLFGILVCTGAYTPVSGETFSVVLEGYTF